MEGPRRARDRCAEQRSLALVNSGERSRVWCFFIILHLGNIPTISKLTSTISYIYIYIYIRYPLVNVYITMERSSIFKGKLSNYQRVTIDPWRRFLVKQRLRRNASRPSADEKSAPVNRTCDGNSSWKKGGKHGTTLWWTYKRRWKITTLMGKSTIHRPFSIAMLVYRRVNGQTVELPQLSGYKQHHWGTNRRCE